MRINTNINSMRTQEYMRQNQDKMNVSMNRLSSGKRINSAADDAAGLAIATRMRAKESGLGVASRNTQDGISMIRTADSGMNSVSNILLRMRDLAVQSANGTNTNENRGALQKEFAALRDQIDYIAQNTQFNGKNLLNGNKQISIHSYDDGQLKNSASVSQQVVPAPQQADSNPEGNVDGGNVDGGNVDGGNVDGGNVDGGNVDGGNVDGGNVGGGNVDVKGTIDIQLTSVSSSSLKAAGEGGKTLNQLSIDNGVVAGVAAASTPDADADATAIANANEAIKAIDDMIESIAGSRATLGATLNRLDFNVENLNNQASNMAASASQIEDADMAKEMSEMTKFKILNEAGISMLSQANQTPQMVSKLLQ
ncbi:flagellin [Bacillus cereus group sp. Bc191]|uniref:flagellin N-terminal helical domain-containing protein n=1 Tax=Bacillus cereus group sp. Bc191 TaxID=3018113 RepID=UPI0022DEDC8C|nr:flagellin [Bacillus cereus group sp. Bc191]MDA2287725.1 flagellin [Bacillus cereus group sp. Bc191]